MVHFTVERSVRPADGPRNMCIHDYQTGLTNIDYTVGVTGLLQAHHALDLAQHPTKLVLRQSKNGGEEAREDRAIHKKTL